MSGSNGNVLNPADKGAILNPGATSEGIAPGVCLPLADAQIIGGGPGLPSTFNNVIAFAVGIGGVVNPGDPVVFTAPPQGFLIDCEALTLQAGAAIVSRDQYGNAGSITIDSATLAANPNDPALSRFTLEVSATYPNVGEFASLAVLVKNPDGGTTYAGQIVVVLLPPS